MKTRRLLYLALLTAVSLVLFIVENQIPAPVPVPGVKLGLGNVIIVAVLFLYGPWEALGVLAVKVFLSALLTGKLGALAYSAAGGLLSWGGMCLLRPLLREKQLWVASVLGAMLHNLGQLLAAMVIADAIAPLADAAFSQTAPGLATAWTGLLAYTLQIYFDFSGYSDTLQAGF